jgi:hypothetical protein
VLVADEAVRVDHGVGGPPGDAPDQAGHDAGALHRTDAAGMSEPFVAGDALKSLGSLTGPRRVNFRR